MVFVGGGFPISYYDYWGVPRTVLVRIGSPARPWIRYYPFRAGIFFPQYYMSKERCRTDYIQLCQNCRNDGPPGRCAASCGVAVGCANHYGITGSMIDDLRYRFPWGVVPFPGSWP